MSSIHNDIHNDVEAIDTTSTYWRSRNPKISQVKFRDIQIKNRYDFGKSAPRRFKNFAWLKKNHRKDWFGVNGRDFGDGNF